MADGGRSQVDIGRRLLALRLALGHTQVSFSRLTGISQPTLANYEAGIRRPELDKAILIVQKTAVTLDWLYLGERSGLPGSLLAILPALDQRATA